MYVVTMPSQNAAKVPPAALFISTAGLPAAGVPVGKLPLAT